MKKKSRQQRKAATRKAIQTAQKAAVAAHENWHDRFRMFTIQAQQSKPAEPRRYWDVKFIDTTISQTFCRNFFYGAKTMNFSVIHEDETENEFEIEVCCEVCSLQKYGWSTAIHNKLMEMVRSNQPIKTPASVDSDEKFKAFVKTL